MNTPYRASVPTLQRGVALWPAAATAAIAEQRYIDVPAWAGAQRPGEADRGTAAEEGGPRKYQRLPHPSHSRRARFASSRVIGAVFVCGGPSQPGSQSCSRPGRWDLGSELFFYLGDFCPLAVENRDERPSADGSAPVVARPLRRRGQSPPANGTLGSARDASQASMTSGYHASTATTATRPARRRFHGVRHRSRRGAREPKEAPAPAPPLSTRLRPASPHSPGRTIPLLGCTVARSHPQVAVGRWILPHGPRPASRNAPKMTASTDRQLRTRNEPSLGARRHEHPPGQAPGACSASALALSLSLSIPGSYLCRYSARHLARYIMIRSLRADASLPSVLFPRRPAT